VISNRGSIYVNGFVSSTLGIILVINVFFFYFSGQFCKNIDDEISYFGSERVVDFMKTSQLWPLVLIEC
jgi:hypothetical protein